MLVTKSSGAIGFVLALCSLCPWLISCQYFDRGTTSTNKAKASLEANQSFQKRILEEPRIKSFSQLPASSQASSLSLESFGDRSLEIINNILPANTTIRFPAEYEAVAAVLLSGYDFPMEAFEIIELLIEFTDVDVFLAGEPYEPLIHPDFVPVTFPVDTIWGTCVRLSLLLTLSLGMVLRISLSTE